MDDVVELTGEAVVERDRLVEELRRIATQGYAHDDGEYEEGVRCVAVPVHDAAGRVVATLSISGPNGRLTRERADGWLPEIRQVAADFSRAVAS